MEYSTRFTQEVRHRLENLKSAIDQDLGSLDSLAPNLTFSQADQILTGASSLLDSYRAFMGHLYRGVSKPSYGARRTAASSGPRGKMEPAALEMMSSQGYLLDKEFIAKYGFNSNAVSRKLQEIAGAYNWHREKTDSGWRYSPPAATPSPEPSGTIITIPKPTMTGDTAAADTTESVRRARRKSKDTGQEQGTG